MTALQNAKSFADAAFQSGKQSASTRAALLKSKHDEKQMEEKEEQRLQKEAAAKRMKEEKDRKTAEEKELKRQKKEAEKAEKKEKKRREKEEGNDAGEEGGRKGGKDRRRGRGAEELQEGQDPACLTTRLPDSEITVMDDLTMFVESLPLGIPCVWKARRPPLKKVLEAHGDCTGKDLHNASVLIQQEWKNFLSNLAEDLQGNSNIKKRCRACSEDMQLHRDALSMDSMVQKHLEQSLGTHDPSTEPATVIEVDALCESMNQVAKIATDRKWPEDKVKAMQQEIAMYKHLHMVGMPKGQVFSGVFTGLYPHLVYQMEGTRAMALVSTSDVAWHISLAWFMVTWLFDFLWEGGGLAVSWSGHWLMFIGFNTLG